jgi:hypothetical protein
MKSLNVNMNYVSCLLLCVILILMVVCCCKKNTEGFVSRIQCNNNNYDSQGDGGWFSDFCKKSIYQNEHNKKEYKKYKKCIRHNSKVKCRKTFMRKRITEYPGLYCNSKCDCPRKQARNRCNKWRNDEIVPNPTTTFTILRPLEENINNRCEVDNTDDNTFKQYCNAYSDAKNKGATQPSITNCEKPCKDRGFQYISNNRCEVDNTDDNTFKQYCNAYSDAKNKGATQPSITNCEKPCKDRGFQYISNNLNHVDEAENKKAAAAEIWKKYGHKEKCNVVMSRGGQPAYGDRWGPSDDEMQDICDEVNKTYDAGKDGDDGSFLSRTGEETGEVISSWKYNNELKKKPPPCVSYCNDLFPK